MLSQFKLFLAFVLSRRTCQQCGKVSRSGVNLPLSSKTDLEAWGKEVCVVEGGKIMGIAATIDVEDGRIETTSQNRPHRPNYFHHKFNPFKTQNRLDEYEP